MMKFISGILAASVLLAILRFTGATPNLQSPLFLAELCGLLALGALVVALIGPEEEHKDEEASQHAIAARISAPAARRPRWPSM